MAYIFIPFLLELEKMYEVVYKVQPNYQAVLVLVMLLLVRDTMPKVNHLKNLDLDRLYSSHYTTKVCRE